MRPTSGLSAVLFDMDGTLIDSEPYWMSSETALVRSFGGTWTQADGVKMVGSGMIEAAEILRGHGVDMPAEDIAAHLIDQVADNLRAHVPWQPGAFELLSELAQAGVPTALVTMSYSVLADIVVAAAPPGTFQAVITGDKVTHDKPHPEPYLAAARALDVPIEHCVAIEDSPTGLRSAIDSGAVSVAVLHTIDIPAGLDAQVIPALAGVGLAQLDEFFAAARVTTRLAARD